MRHWTAAWAGAAVMTDSPTVPSRPTAASAVRRRMFLNLIRPRPSSGVADPWRASPAKKHPHGGTVVRPRGGVEQRKDNCRTGSRGPAVAQWLGGLPADAVGRVVAPLREWRKYYVARTLRSIDRHVDQCSTP